MKSHTSNNYPQIKLGIIQNISCNTVKSTGTTFIRGRTVARAPWIRRGRVRPRTTGMQRDDGGGKEKAFLQWMGMTGTRLLQCSLGGKMSDRG